MVFDAQVTRRDDSVVLIAVAKRDPRRLDLRAGVADLPVC